MNSYSRNISGRPFSSFRIAATTALLLGIISGCSGGGGGGSSPVAVSDSYTSNPGHLTITVSSPGVLANDTGSALTAEIVGPPVNHSGTFTLNANGSFTYTLQSTATATTDSFTYRARNGTSTSSIATVTITITPPVAVPDTFSVNAPGGSITNGNLLANDTPATGLVAEKIGPDPAQAASFTFNSDGTFSYQHDGGDATSVSFQYRTKVGAIYSNTATATITINQPPVAQDVCPTIIDGQPSVTGNLAATDPNGVTPTYEIVSQPGNGSVSTTSAGVFTYIPTPTSSRRGMDTFTFRARDASNPSLVSAPATVTILNGGKVRIMPLGDSITEGIVTGGTPADDPPLAQRVGYRKKLYDDLITSGFPIDFVGSQSAGGSILADPDHEGHPGWCDDNNPFCNPSTPPGSTIADSVFGFLDNRPADVILLHIGTNQFDTSNAGVNTILNNINEWARQNYPVKVFLARIIPSVDGRLDVQTFNNNVDAIAGNRPPGVTVFRVDQQGELRLPDDPNKANSTLMGDTYHPNDDGYRKMADRWKADLLNAGALPSCP